MRESDTFGHGRHARALIQVTGTDEPEPAGFIAGREATLAGWRMDARGRRRRGT